jgi:hypothetical protein
MVCTGSLRTARRDSQFANQPAPSHQQRLRGSVHPSHLTADKPANASSEPREDSLPSHEKAFSQATTSLFAKRRETASSTPKIPTREEEHALRLADTSDTHETGTSTGADTTSEEPGRLHQRPHVCSMHQAGCTHQDGQRRQAGSFWRETERRRWTATRRQSLLLAPDLSFGESRPSLQQWLDSKATVFDFQCITRTG